MPTTSQRCWTFIVAILFLFTPSAQADTVPTPSPFTVGVIIPLTGPLSDYGNAIQKSFVFAEQTYPEKFKNIHFIYQDSAYDGKTALSALQSLVNAGGVDLYYTWGVTPNESLLPVLKTRKLPVIAETSFKESVVGKPLAVRAAPTGDMTAKVLTEEITRREYRSVGIVLVDIPYYRDILRTLKTELEAAHIKLTIIEEVAADFNAFPTIITKLKQRAYDAVGVFLLNDQVITFYKEANSLNLKMPTFGAGIHDSQDLITQAGKGAEGAFFVGYDVEPDFQTKWLSVHGNDSRIGTIANAYDTAILIAELFADGHSTTLTPEAIVARFKTETLRKGVSGTFGYAESPDAGKHFDFPVSLRLVKNGKVTSPTFGVQDWRHRYKFEKSSSPRHLFSEDRKATHVSR